MAEENAAVFPIIGDATSFKEAFSEAEKTAEETANRIGEKFDELGGILKRAVGWLALGAAVDKGLELGAQQVKLQKVQSILLNNQAALGVSLKNISGNIVDQSGKLVKTNEQVANAGRAYSVILDKQANSLSIQTGIAKNQFIEAQNLLLPNQDLAKLYQAHASDMQLTLQNAANMSEVMAGGSGGSVVGSARLLSRVLTDPAKRMSAMVRTGVSLSKAEQQRIKATEATSGLLAAQDLLLQDINKHVQGIAAASRSPMDRLKNDLMLIYQSIGVGLLPILESFAQALTPLLSALQPVFESMATAIQATSEALGRSLGDIFKVLVPLFNALAEGILPAILTIAEAVINVMAQVAKPLVNILNVLINGKGDFKGLAYVLTEMANTFAKNLQPAAEAVAKAFDNMTKNGQMQQFFDSMNATFQALAPILPMLATTMANFAIATLPIFAQMLPYIATLVEFFAKLTEWGFKAVNWLLRVFDAVVKLGGSVGVLRDALAALLLVWFAPKLFLTPIELVTSALGKLLSIFPLIGNKLMATGRGFATFFGGIKNVLGGGAGGLVEGGVAGGILSKIPLLKKLSGVGKIAEEGIAGSAILSKIPMLGKLGGGAAGKIEGEVAKEVEKHSNLAVKMFSKIPVIGKLSGLFGKLLGKAGGATGDLGGMLSTSTKNPTVNLTNAIINLTKVIEKGGGGIGGSGGSSVGGEVENAVKNKAESELQNVGKKGIEKLLQKGLLRMGEGRLGAMAEKFGATRVGGLLGKMGGTSLAKKLGLSLGEDALAGGAEMGGAEALANLIPGIGQIVSAGLLAYQFRHQIGSAIKGIGHFLGFGYKAPPTYKTQHGNNKLGSYIKFHQGGMVPGPKGNEVPAILQAGEAVLSIAAVRQLGINRGGSAPSAPSVNIVVNGNADHHTVELIKHHVESQFKEFHRTLRAMGR
jgi:hypothetical protein